VRTSRWMGWHGLALRAHMQAGRARESSQRDQDFLTLWKDADPDISILKNAKSKYAKLR
jgi:hypothetical protein